MTVKQVIERLKTFDQGLEVESAGPDSGGYDYVTSEDIRIEQVGQNVRIWVCEDIKIHEHLH